MQKTRVLFIVESISGRVRRHVVDVLENINTEKGDYYNE